MKQLQQKQYALPVQVEIIIPPVLLESSNFTIL